MSQQAKHIYEFGPFRLDAAEHLLLREGEAVPLTPKAFDLLLALVQGHGHLLEKEELLKKVWPDTFVEEANLTYNISLLRKALGDGENGQHYIQTAPKRGYRFAASVRKVDVDNEEKREHRQKEQHKLGNESEMASGANNFVQSTARLAWAVALVLFVVTLGLIWAHFMRRSTPDVMVMKSSILPPEKSSFVEFAISPDGRHLAFTAATGGKVQLWVRALDATEAQPLAGTQGAIFPFWSPDSRFIGFFADDRLKKIEFAGGLAVTLCDVPGATYGGTWSRDGIILCGSENGLFWTSAAGGKVTQVTAPDRSRHELSHQYPTFLPDGRHFLYSIREEAPKEVRGVYLGSLDGTVKRRLLDDNTRVKYMAAGPGDTTGWLLFVRDGALLSQPFDNGRFEFTGEPFSLTDKLGSALGSLYNFTFSISETGILVFDPILNRRRRQYIWMDRHGQQITTLDVTAGISLQLSPDDKRFIATRPDPPNQADLWLYDVSGGNATRFTFDPATDLTPVWAPDGSRIVWASNRGKVFDLYQKAASGAGEETLLWKSDYNKGPTDWSRTGLIIYGQKDPKTKWDVWVLPMIGSGEAKPYPVVQTEANEIYAMLSPDGRWLAYASDASGRYEIYVQSFPDGSGKRQVSTGGGNSPRWRRDGQELFYYGGDGKLMAAQSKSGASLEVGPVVSLFEFHTTFIENYAPSPYAVTADGQRFLINAVVELQPNAPLTLWVNWPAAVKK